MVRYVAQACATTHHDGLERWRVPGPSEPGGLADLAHGVPAAVLVESVEVQLAVEVIDLVLQRLRQQTLPDQLDRVAVEVDPGRPGNGVAEDRIPETGDGQAALALELGLAAQLDDAPG